jgi:peptide/nickel transport system permease protein
MSHIWIMIAQRLGLGLVTLFVVSLIIFLGTELLPGDFAQEILGQSATPETVAALRERLGLNDPMHVRYINWLRTSRAAISAKASPTGNPSPT